MSDLRFPSWQDFYDSKAKKADWIEAHGWGYSAEVALSTIEDIREKLGVEPGHKLLEVGCGSGMVLNRLLAPGQIGWGVDKSESLLRSAERFGVTTGQVRLVLGEAYPLPFPDESFDRVLCYSVFINFPTTGYACKALEELIRVCRPGGIILVGDIYGYWQLVRARWKSQRLTLETARALLLLPWLRPVSWLLWPLRTVARVMRRALAGDAEVESPELHYRLYGHRFFKRVGKRHGCLVEILQQHIEGRDKISERRFDVRMTKR